MKDALHKQDCLYTVVEKHGDGTQHVRVVGSLVDYLLAPDDPEAVVERMASDETSCPLTITEGGYARRPMDDGPKPTPHGRRAPTAFGIITRRCGAAASEASRRSRDVVRQPPGNGRLTRTV